MRKAEISRTKKETQVQLMLNLDGTGKNEISTGIGFLDHMLDLFSFHGKFDLEIKCAGDTNVDSHHTAEDIGICLGQAFTEAMGDKKGINRYAGMYLPMDEALCRTVVDISSRPYLMYKVNFNNQMLGTIDTQVFEEMLRAFVTEARITLHTEVIYGSNDHHKIEAVFKSLGTVLTEAVRITGERVSSTKGVL